MISEDRLKPNDAFVHLRQILIVVRLFGEVLESEDRLADEVEQAAGVI